MSGDTGLDLRATGRCGAEPLDAGRLWPCRARGRSRPPQRGAAPPSDCRRVRPGPEACAHGHLGYGRAKGERPFGRSPRERLRSEPGRHPSWSSSRRGSPGSAPRSQRRSPPTQAGSGGRTAAEAGTGSPRDRGLRGAWRPRRERRGRRATRRQAERRRSQGRPAPRTCVVPRRRARARNRAGRGGSGRVGSRSTRGPINTTLSEQVQVLTDDVVTVAPASPGSAGPTATTTPRFPRVEAGCEKQDVLLTAVQEIEYLSRLFVAGIDAFDGSVALDRYRRAHQKGALTRDLQRARRDSNPQPSDP